MENKKFRVLLAYDGSDLALNAARYVAAAFPLDQTEVVLFYVDSKIPRSFWEMEKEQNFKFTAPDIRASMAAQVKLINQCMDRASTILVTQGLPSDALTVKIHAKNQGIVRDLVKEYRRNYDAVVVGRRGYSKIKDILVGSVPEKLLGKIRGIPLIVVGGIPSYKKILVAFDGTREILNAIKRLGQLINPSECKILLCHAVKSDTALDKEEHNKLESLFKESVDYLKSIGFNKEQVVCEVVTEGNSPTYGIMHRASQGAYGTIVVGRRGLSFMNKFFQGRVGDKIFQLAGNLTVWVVQ